MIGKRMFLVVDDDNDDCDFFCEAVNELEPLIECIVANDGEEALEKLRDNIKCLPEFIFLDLNMPRMNGKACLVELKKDNVLSQIPVIIYTTSSSLKDKEEMLSLGARYFLTKPTDFKDLRKQIAFVMELE